jgi:hypothetical protein
MQIAGLRRKRIEFLPVIAASCVGLAWNDGHIRFDQPGAPSSIRLFIDSPAPAPVQRLVDLACVVVAGVARRASRLYLER